MRIYFLFLQRSFYVDVKVLTDTIKLELVYNTKYTIWSGDWKKQGEESQHLSASGGLKEKKSRRCLSKSEHVLTCSFITNRKHQLTNWLGRNERYWQRLLIWFCSDNNTCFPLRRDWAARFRNKHRLYGFLLFEPFVAILCDMPHIEDRKIIIEYMSVNIVKCVL